jgi:hypothetical protein
MHANTHTHTHTHTHTRQLHTMMGMLIHLVILILLQCIHLSKHYVYTHKYTQLAYIILPYINDAGHTV